MTKEFSWHDIEISEAFDRLGSSPDGLSETEATARLREHGPNELDQTGGINAWHMLLEQLRNPLNFVLVAAALISFFAGKTLDTVVIAIIIIFNTAMGFVQEFRAEKACRPSGPWSPRKRRFSGPVKVRRERARRSGSRPSTWCPGTCCC